MRTNTNKSKYTHTRPHACTQRQIFNLPLATACNQLYYSLPPTLPQLLFTFCLCAVVDVVAVAVANIVSRLVIWKISIVDVDVGIRIYQSFCGPLQAYAHHFIPFPPFALLDLSTCIYIYAYISEYVCVCVFVYVLMLMKRTVLDTRSKNLNEIN